ncbi:hypothetical protein GGR56DRAFT_20023 [Xylariaceae sp. FL0804]|nr:hypothetical protein GGR56DRAFT_20023 [Xylariaceae sp. FL0804]
MASSVQLHPKASGAAAAAAATDPLPQLMRTPSGLAILELQGTINLPSMDESGGDINTQELQIGRIVFPDYHPETQAPSSTSWMKRVHLYVGQHQRLTGEVKKLPRAIAVIRKRPTSGNDTTSMDLDSGTTGENLEVVEIVKHKLVFSQRPEPVGGGT